MIACRSHLRDNSLFFIWAYTQIGHNVKFLSMMFKSGIMFNFNIMLNLGIVPNWTCEFMAKFGTFFFVFNFKHLCLIFEHFFRICHTT